MITDSIKENAKSIFLFKFPAMNIKLTITGIPRKIIKKIFTLFWSENLFIFILFINKKANMKKASKALDGKTRKIKEEKSSKKNPILLLSMANFIRINP